MMNITVLTVGKLREPFWRDACAEYRKRLGSRVNVVEIDAERIAENASPAEIAAALTREGARLLERLPRSALLVALCVEGSAWTSEQLADRLSAWAVSGHSHIGKNQRGKNN